MNHSKYRHAGCFEYNENQKLKNEKINPPIRLYLCLYRNRKSPAPRKFARYRHPTPTFGYALEGELESTFDGKVYHYKAGDAFYETPNGLHSGTRNMSKDKPAKLLAFFVGDKGTPFLVPEKQ